MHLFLKKFPGNCLTPLRTDRTFYYAVQKSDCWE